SDNRDCGRAAAGFGHSRGAPEFSGTLLADTAAGIGEEDCWRPRLQTRPQASAGRIEARGSGSETSRDPERCARQNYGADPVLERDVHPEYRARSGPAARMRRLAERSAAERSRRI